MWVEKLDWGQNYWYGHIEHWKLLVWPHLTPETIGMGMFNVKRWISGIVKIAKNIHLRGLVAIVGIIVSSIILCPGANHAYEQPKYIQIADQ